MKITQKLDFKIASLPLPIFDKVLIADAVSKNEDNFSVYVGLDNEMVNQLKKLSLDESDEEIQKNTSDKKRFSSYEEWYKKSRTPFALIHKNTNKLAAITWFGPSPLKEIAGNFHASAWRAYPDFRGKGLMKEFVKFAMNIYASKIPDVKFSATIKKENAASIGFAQAIGFKEIHKNTDGSIVMIK